MRQVITQMIDMPSSVSDEEVRFILMNLLEHLKVDAVRYTTEDKEAVSYIAIEKET